MVVEAIRDNLKIVICYHIYSLLLSSKQDSIEQQRIQSLKSTISILSDYYIYTSDSYWKIILIFFTKILFILQQDVQHFIKIDLFLKYNIYVVFYKID